MMFTVDYWQTPQTLLALKSLYSSLDHPFRYLSISLLADTSIFLALQSLSINFDHPLR
jgi:hypothetical protein